MYASRMEWNQLVDSTCGFHDLEGLLMKLAIAYFSPCTRINQFLPADPTWLSFTDHEAHDDGLTVLSTLFTGASQLMRLAYGVPL